METLGVVIFLVAVSTIPMLAIVAVIALGVLAVVALFCIFALEIDDLRRSLRKKKLKKKAMKKREEKEKKAKRADMKADKIIKNAKIYTADKENPLATALVVKDGKFAYVGDEAGLADFEGEPVDLGGKFVMPAIIDSHVHVTMGAAFEYTDMGTPIQCASKAEALEYMAEYIRNNPGLKCYRFILERKFLQGEDIVKEDLDEICPDGDIVVMEGEAHSVWVNSSFLERLGITDDTPDPVPGLSYFVRDNGHLTGNIFETAEMRFILDGAMDLTDEQLDAALVRWIDYCKEFGVSYGTAALLLPGRATTYATPTS